MKTSTWIALTVLVLVTSFAYVAFFMRSADIACDSEVAKRLLTELVEERGLKMESIEAFSTVDTSKTNQTECKAFYKTNWMKEGAPVNYTLTTTDESNQIILELI